MLSHMNFLFFASEAITKIFLVSNEHLCDHRSSHQSLVPTILGQLHEFFSSISVYFGPNPQIAYTSSDLFWVKSSNFTYYVLHGETERFKRSTLHIVQQ